MYLVCQALLEPGDEVIIPDPTWPPCAGNILAAQARPVGCPLYERLGWRFDLDELERTITPATRAIYINSPHNPTGGVLTRDDVERIAALVRDRNLWLISDEAYEDVLFDGATHVSPASLPGMYERTLSVYTFSKTYAMTGLRLGYVAVPDARLRERMKKALFYTCSNVTSVVQYGGIGALEGSQDCVAAFREELRARRDLFYAGIARAGGRAVRRRAAPRRVLRVPAHRRATSVRRPPRARRRCRGRRPNTSFRRAGSGACLVRTSAGRAKGYVRFCFARDRAELTGALTSMRELMRAASEGSLSPQA